MRRIFFSVATALVVGLGIIAPSSAATPPSAPADACVPVEHCCKVCDGGLACGNSCISRAKTCNKGRGCACNKSELCGS